MWSRTLPACRTASAELGSSSTSSDEPKKRARSPMTGARRRICSPRARRDRAPGVRQAAAEPIAPFTAPSSCGVT
jgi:hypothetical protein